MSGKTVLKLVVDNRKATESVLPQFVPATCVDAVDHAAVAPDYHFQRAENLVENGFKHLEMEFMKESPGIYLLSTTYLNSFCIDESDNDEPGLFFIYLSNELNEPRGFPTRMTIEIPLPFMVSSQARLFLLELCDEATREANCGAFFTEGDGSAFYRLSYPLYTPDVLDRFLVYRLIGDATKEVTAGANRMLSRIVVEKGRR